MDPRLEDLRPGGTEAGSPAGTSGTTVRYWAGARAAAGVDGETFGGLTTLADLTAAMTDAHPDLAPVLPVCSLLVDGLVADAGDVLPDGAVVEVLPPFAGG